MPRKRESRYMIKCQASKLELKRNSIGLGMARTFDDECYLKVPYQDALIPYLPPYLLVAEALSRSYLMHLSMHDLEYQAFDLSSHACCCPCFKGLSITVSVHALFAL